MHSSLSWIEWLDRLNRVLHGALTDFAAYARSGSARSVAAIERSRRLLAALTEELHLLNPDVLSSGSGEPRDAAGDLRASLHTLLFRLNDLPAVPVTVLAGRDRDRHLSAIDFALREARYSAASLLRPRLRRA